MRVLHEADLRGDGVSAQPENRSLGHESELSGLSENLFIHRLVAARERLVRVEERQSDQNHRLRLRTPLRSQQKAASMKRQASFDFHLP